jgi:STELLO glycosyltransferase-like protein
MHNFIVITSVFDPTDAIKSFASKKDYQLIVVADQKTPASWNLEGAEFISLESQEKEYRALASEIPFNHYSRKMFGYLRAMHAGADFIIDADDDITPKADWSFPPTDGEYDTISSKGFINVYQYFTGERIWPRGLPLHEMIKTPGLNVARIRKPVNVGIWQGLSDRQPDVDAIFRSFSRKDYYFDNADPLVLDSSALSPFNSQNTSFRKAVFPLLYLPATVSFRFTDILRSYIAQPILWSHGFSLGFVKANTIQNRNPHDLLSDFISEIPMYLNAEKIPPIVQSIISDKKSIGDNLFNAYQELVREKITGEKELEILEAWLKESQIRCI